MSKCDVYSLISENINSYANDKGKPIVDERVVLDKKYFGLFNQEFSRSLKEKLKMPVEGEVLITKDSEAASLRPDVYGFRKTYTTTRWFYNEPLVQELEKRRKELVRLEEVPDIVDETGQIKLFTETQKANLLESKVQFENEIKKLPMAIFNSIDIVDTVPSSLLGSDSVFFAMKDILSENGINDPLLINWVGINKDIIGHPRNLKSEEQIRQIAQSVFDKKTKEDRYIEFKVNKIALESFRNWKKALEGYPIVFQDIMLTHAIKHLNNPNRRSKYVLELSPVALTNTFGILINKPHEANRLGKLYDMEVLATVSDAVNHEPSASGKGYWVYIPRTQNPGKDLGFKTYEEFKKDTERRLETINSKLDLEDYNSLVAELEKVKSKKPVFYSQEPNLTRKEADNYGFQDFSYVRVESSYSRGDNQFPEYLGPNYQGYYIHGYNTEQGKPSTKIVPITKAQAEEIWSRGRDNNPLSGYEVEDRNVIFRIEEKINSIDRNQQKKIELEEKLKSVSPSDWDNEQAIQYRTNVETLRKLSPSTWCTASSMTDYYVQNYDNYLLIVNGVTVAGIEVGINNTSSRRLHGTKVFYLFKSDGYLKDGYAIYSDRKEELDDKNLLTSETTKNPSGVEFTYINLKEEDKEKRPVKEVTSRANNGIAPIDHLDDVIAFFEKHNLDLDNDTIKRAIRAKEKGESDVDMMNEVEFDAEHIEHLLWLEQQERIAIDIHNGEYEYEPNNWEAEHRYYDEFVAGIDNINDARQNIDIVKNYYEALNPELRAFEDIARAAVENNSHNITYVDVNLPFYDELAIQAVTKSPYVWNYLPEEKKDLPGLRERYDQYNLLLNEADELPFSKTDTNLIQGYYDPNTDKVVVVRSNTPVDEASKVAIHEVAHRGMLRMAKDLGGMQQLGEALSAAEQQLMQKLPELLKRTGHKSLEGLMLDYGFTKESKEGKIKLLMELTARWAETLVNKPKPSWWKKLIQSITEWIKNFTGKTLNEQEVNELVGGFVQYGTKSFKPTKASTQPTLTETTMELSIEDQLEDFIEENSNMPEEDAKDYFFGCKL